MLIHIMFGGIIGFNQFLEVVVVGSSCIFIIFELAVAVAVVVVVVVYTITITIHLFLSLSYD